MEMMDMGMEMKKMMKIKMMGIMEKTEMEI
jgi:hypothetical protein